MGKLFALYYSLLTNYSLRITHPPSPFALRPSPLALGHLLFSAFC